MGNLSKDTQLQMNKRQARISSGLIHPWDMVQLLCNRRRGYELNTDLYPKEHSSDLAVDIDILSERETQAVNDGVLINRHIKHSTEDRVAKYNLTVVFKEVSTDPHKASCHAQIDYYEEGPVGLINILHVDMSKWENTELIVTAYSPFAPTLHNVKEAISKLASIGPHSRYKANELPQELEALLLEDPIAKFIIQERFPNMLRAAPSC